MSSQNARGGRGFETEPADWAFIVPAALIWACGLLLAVLDFRRMRSEGRCITPITAIGVAGTVAGVRIRLRAKRALGRRYSYGLRLLEGHELVTSGVYAHVRHPGYAGTLLADASVPLIFSSLRGSLVTLLLIPCFLYRIGVEEQMLIERFGDDYLRYMKRTRRLIPGIF